MFIMILHGGVKVSVGYAIDHSLIVAMRSQQMRPSGESAQGLGIGQFTGVELQSLVVNVNCAAVAGGTALVIIVAPFAKQTSQHGGRLSFIRFGAFLAGALNDASNKLCDAKENQKYTENVWNPGGPERMFQIHC